MYTWKVTLEVEWKYTTTPAEGKSTFSTDVDSEDYTVAAPTGLKAIEVAKKVALDKEERGFVDDWSNSDEKIKEIKGEPVQIIDVVGLELKDELDG